MIPTIKVIILFITIGLSPLQLPAQTKLTWNTLAEVSFEEQYFEEIEAYWLIPQFSQAIKQHENQDVIVEGYLIVLDIEDNFCVLSQNPFSSCFFCGGAGPESIVELSFENAPKKVKIDQKVQIQGRLKLNIMDFDHFNYIIKDARIID